MRIKTRNIKLPFMLIEPNTEYEFEILSPRNKHDIKWRIGIFIDNFLLEIELNEFYIFDEESVEKLFVLFNDSNLDIENTKSYDKVYKSYKENETNLEKEELKYFLEDIYDGME